MKKLKFIAMIAILAGALIVSLTSLAEDQKTEKTKPYPLDTCLVCSMDLKMMSKPVVFVYQGQEIKVCDKDEKATFDKDPGKYMKKLAAAEAKLKK
jgi:YHS domain-containing protein